MTTSEILLGDEAVALAAIHEGISGAYGYPGTPSTEIIEYITPRAAKNGISACWAANEKVALELALGMSFAGKKTIVTMKHVGLNVAMDPFMSSAITGINGEMVIVVADDPGMHSSQNEQDTRQLAMFAHLPCFEPHDQQSAYDMTRAAFQLSKSIRLPVVMRLVTRLAHSRSSVIVGESISQNTLNKVTDRAAFTLLPSHSRSHYKKLLEKKDKLIDYSNNSIFNEFNISGKDKSRGIIATGIAINYVKEAFGGEIPHPYLAISSYPPPISKIKELINCTNELVIAEEGAPMLEEMIRGLLDNNKVKVLGKLNGFLPRTGELDPTIVASAFGFKTEDPNWPTLDKLPGRPPALCKGCPHIDSFNAVREAFKEYPNFSVFSDIGCYTLGFFDPHNIGDACIEMGGSIGMAVGAAHAGLFPIAATIGDSTFIHSGLSCLATAVKQNSNIVVFVLDNDITAMTGGQQSIANGENLVNAIKGIGVNTEHLHVLIPLPKNTPENTAIVKKEIEYNGVSVIIFKRPCIHNARR